MPRLLSPAEKHAWYVAMIDVTKNKQWTQGSYNTSMNDRMRRGTAMGQYMEDAHRVIPPALCNCWEAVMLAAIDAGIYTKEEVKKILTSAPKGVARNLLIKYMLTNPD